MNPRDRIYQIVSDPRMTPQQKREAIDGVLGPVAGRSPSPAAARGASWLFPGRSAYNARGDVAEAYAARGMAQPSAAAHRGSDFLFPGRAAYNDRGDAAEARGMAPRPIAIAAAPSSEPAEVVYRPPPTPLYFDAEADEGDGAFQTFDKGNG